MGTNSIIAEEDSGEESVENKKHKNPVNYDNM
jgi:hypothetical protein